MSVCFLRRREGQHHSSCSMPLNHGLLGSNFELECMRMKHYGHWHLYKDFEDCWNLMCKLHNWLLLLHHNSAQIILFLYQKGRSGPRLAGGGMIIEHRAHG